MDIEIWTWNQITLVYRDGKEKYEVRSKGLCNIETKPIATPIMKYETGPLLNDLMECPTPPKNAYAIGELMDE